LTPLVRPPLTVSFTRMLVQMVCERQIDAPPSSVDLCALSEPDVPEMMALVAVTHPGPFKPRTYTLGTYVGVRIGGMLAAMGRQRMHLPGYREVSAICTHPDFRGRGLARTIVTWLTAAIFDEGLTPFLHAEEQNESALALYRSLGFVERARLPVVVAE